MASIVTASIVGEARNQLPDIEPFVLASALAFLSGAVICLVGLLRLGWIVDLISLAAVSAFITGSAITIVSDQVSVLLGIRGISTKDPAYLVAIHTLKHLGSVKLDAAMGVSALVLLYIRALSSKEEALFLPLNFKDDFRYIVVHHDKLACQPISSH